MQQDPWWLWLVVALGLLAFIGLIYGVGRMLRKFGIGSHERISRTGAAALELQSIFEPSKRHVIEARQKKRVERDSEGDPPTGN